MTPTIEPSSPVVLADGAAPVGTNRVLRHKLHMGDFGGGPVIEALACLDTLITYGRWQVSPESPSHHPTLPSAVALASATLDRALLTMLQTKQGDL